MIPREQAGDHARRVSDADRERVATALRDECAAGKLDYDELSHRLELAYGAKTVGDLAVAVRDLDVPIVAAPSVTPPADARVSPLRSGGFRAHLTSYGLVNGFLVGIWVVTGAHGEFWPIWPMMGWGLGLGFHAMGVASHQRHRAERSARREAQRMRHEARHAERHERYAERHQRYAERHQRDAERLDRRRHDRDADERRAAPAGPARVSVMFTDVVDSTRLNEALGDEEWIRVLSHHRAMLRTVFAAHGGTEVGGQGDGFLARFSSPADAVGCAVEIQRRLAAQREAAGFALRVRIGIHAGDAIDHDGDLIGSVINLAARVLREARPDEILVTEQVADGAGRSFELEDRGLVELRGFAKPRHLLSVRWPKDD